MRQERIELATAVAALRAEFQTARDDAVGKGLRFEAERLELEFQVQVTQETTGNARIRFWLVEAGTDLRQERATTQTVRLALRPVAGDPDRPETVQLAGR